MEASVTLKKVGKLVKDKTVLAGLTFGVEKGSLVAIVGDNDSGKSTILKILAGFESPDYGQVFLYGLDSQKRRIEARKLLGFVPHENDLDPDLTLAQNIKFHGHLFGINDQTIQSRLSTYAKKLDLELYLDELASQVSQGIQKRAMIIRGLIHDPDILILDEPTGFMDSASIRKTWDLITELKKEKTIIYASNALQEVEQSHDRILVLRHGQIILDGHLDKLLESTMDYHQFQIEFEELSDELYTELSNVNTVVSPNRLGNIFHFYGRARNVFFDVLKQVGESEMIDLNVKKLGLRDLLDSEFAGDGL